MKKIIILISIVIVIMTTYALAEVDPNYMIRRGYENPIYMNHVDNGNIDTIIKHITFILGAIGLVVGLCVGIIYAIMWITATPNKKADLKERILPLVLGIILLFGGPGMAAAFISGLAHLLQNF